MNALALMQLARVKGLLLPEAASTALGIDDQEIAQAFEQFRVNGWLVSTPRGWRLTPDGRRATAAMLEEERATLDASLLRTFYEEFCVVNLELKATITAWQLRVDGTPNDHTDAAYDRAVTARLDRTHV